MLRETIGDPGTLMFDANQNWDLRVATRMCGELARFNPLWIEEPTHPDDFRSIRPRPTGGRPFSPFG